MFSTVDKIIWIPMHHQSRNSLQPRINLLAMKIALPIAGLIIIIIVIIIVACIYGCIKKSKKHSKERDQSAMITMNKLPYI